MSETPPRVAAFFERAGLIALAVIFFLLVAEGLTRVVDRIVNDVPLWGQDKDSTLYTEHPFLYKVPRPGARYDRFEVNQHGFRGRGFAVPKPAGVFRLLTLGGSAAWDSNVSGTDATWAAQLEDRLNAEPPAPGVRVEVVNGGVPGYNSAESLMNLVWRGLPVDPDAVLVYQGYNDFKPNRAPGFKADYSHWRMRDHTTLRALSRKVRFLYYFRKLVVWLNRYDGPQHDAVTEPGIRAFQDNLRRIAVLARDRGIQPVFATYGMSVTPENLEQHPRKYRYLTKYLPYLTPAGVLDAHRRYNEAVTALGQELQVPVIDVAAAVPQDFEHFTDHCHLTDAGSATAAAAMAEALKLSLDWSATPPRPRTDAKP